MKADQIEKLRDLLKKVGTDFESFSDNGWHVYLGGYLISSMHDDRKGWGVFHSRDGKIVGCAEDITARQAFWRITNILRSECLLLTDTLSKIDSLHLTREDFDKVFKGQWRPTHGVEVGVGHTGFTVAYGDTHLRGYLSRRYDELPPGETVEGAVLAVFDDIAESVMADLQRVRGAIIKKCAGGGE